MPQGSGKIEFAFSSDDQSATNSVILCNVKKIVESALRKKKNREKRKKYAAGLCLAASSHFLNSIIKFFLKKSIDFVRKSYYIYIVSTRPERVLTN